MAMESRDWINHYGWDGIPVPLAYLLPREPLLSEIYRRHRFKAGILRLGPRSYYDWHIDTRRGVGVNVLLSTGGHHHSLFSPDYSEVHDDGDTTGNHKMDPRVYLHRFEELEYEPHIYYLYNNQVHHTVYNFGKTRYLFSIEFEEDKDSLSYNGLLGEILKFTPGKASD